MKAFIEMAISEGSPNFTWKEALFLPRWGIYAIPGEVEFLENIRKTALKMQAIRDIFGRPIAVTSWFRPKPYNALIGGALQSSHIKGMAVDFIVTGCSSEVARGILKPRLKELNIRMEAMPTPHVHIDLNCTDEMSIEKRYFLPRSKPK